MPISGKSEDFFFHSQYRTGHTNSVTHLCPLVNMVMGHFSKKIVLRAHFDDAGCTLLWPDPYLPYLNLASSSQPFSTAPIEFQIIIGVSSRTMP